MQIARCRQRRSELDSPSAELDVDLLLCHVLDRPRYYLYAHDDIELTGAQLRAFEALLARRAAGEPIAYLTGVAEFWSLPLKVAPSTLIPRADTELLVEWILEKFSAQTVLRVLDLGTGTGAIALALASERPKWQITGVDLQSAAVELAQANAQALQLPVEFLQSNWFEAVSGRQFDVIVSNPPYIEADDPHLIGPGVAFEPHTALVSGDDGLQDIRQIANDSPAHLAAGGVLLLEHGYRQATPVAAILRDAGFSGVENRRDYGGNPRATWGRLGEGECDAR
ncbi:peptide chain release factor N(5)-glutamine methyltransferase [Litorivivens lipolytica]|nr:peptide chain release factor N(5)-glutamine methyltransferase [Litorivivens lipolytica]